MFKPDENDDRINYSTILMPPDGYKLDKAIGTTYSLDLEALTAISICLGLAEESDSRLLQNPISMLNALQKVSDKLVLFCEAGQIKVPSRHIQLAMLLEKMVVEIALPRDKKLGSYPLFHPKAWILSYIDSYGDKKYRFVVMSRNLTFSRSWDIGFAVDSSKNARQREKTKPICDFLDYLAKNVDNTIENAAAKRNLLFQMRAELRNVSFSLDSKEFGENFAILPLGIGKKAYVMQKDMLFDKEKGSLDELIVMSPFLSRDVIADFNKLANCKRTLITRRSELGKLKASDVNNFTIYALKDEIIDGEEEISDELAAKMKQDIHAKIYLIRRNKDVSLYLGSMNATYSAINKNVELMLRLDTDNTSLDGDKFLADIFCGSAGDKKNPFEEIRIDDILQHTVVDDVNRSRLEQKIKELCRSKRQAVVSKDENTGGYKIIVEFEKVQVDDDIKISPLNSRQEQSLSKNMEFTDLEIWQLSEFYRITAISGEDTISRLIMIPTTGFPDNREGAMVNSVVKDRSTFVEYIAFVLGDDYISSMLESRQMKESGFLSHSPRAMPAIYEKMLKTSVEEPDRLKDIGYVLKIITDKDIVPNEFRKLYETFCHALKIRG